MALGNTYGNNKQETKRISIYSNYRLMNSESTIDKTSMSFEYWNGLLKISIAPKLSDDPNSFDFDYKNAAVVYLSQQKARIFFNEITAFKGTKLSNAGVPAGSGIIQIVNSKEFGGTGDSACIVIRSIDENGKSTGRYIYECKENYYYGIRNYSDKKDTVEFDKEFYKGLEIDMILDVLRTFFEAMTGASGYAAADAYDVSHLKQGRIIDSIAEKLGVATNSPASGNRGNASFFNNSTPTPAANKSFNNASLDSLIGDIDGD